MTGQQFARTMGAAALGVGLFTAGVACSQEQDAPPPADPAVAEVQEAERVVVIVDGQKLTAQEAENMVGQRVQQMQGRVPQQQLQSMIPQISREVVDQFIAKVLLNKAATEQKAAVTDADIQKVLDEITPQIPEGMTLEEALAARGMTMEKLRADIREDQGIRKLLETTLPQKFEISDEQIAAFYKEQEARLTIPETVHARHILVKVEDPENAEAMAEGKKEADALKKKLDEGADFAEMAKAESDCPSSARGGDLGTFGRGQMVGPFEEAAFSQEKNVVGPVIETRFGYHIVEVLEHNQAGVRQLDEVKDDIRKFLENQEKGKAFTAYIDTLKKDVEISYPLQEQQMQEQQAEPAEPEQPQE